jgi:hypothetical protein
MAIEMPEDLREDATRTETRIWEKCVDEYVQQQTVAKENLKTAFSLIGGKCLDLMCQRLEASNNFHDLSSKGDAIIFLNLIKNTIYNFQSQ